MRYFVSGAATFLGRAITRKLIEAGHEVITVARKPERARDELDSGVEVVYGDILWKQTLYDALKDVDGIYHTASYHHYKTKEVKENRNVSVHLSKNIKETLKELKEARAEAKDTGISVAERQNVEATRILLEAAKEMKIKRVVYTGTMAVYSDTRGRMLTEEVRYTGPWNSEYEFTMWKAHHTVVLKMAQEGLPVIILQPGLLYGPGDNGYAHQLIYNFLKRGLADPQDRMLRTYPRKTSYCWSYVDDVADAHVVAMKRGSIGENYFLTGPVSTVEGVLKMINNITGLALPKYSLPPGLLRFESAVMKILGGLVSVEECYSDEALRSIAGTTSLGKYDKAEAILSYKPRTLYEGLRTTLYYEMNQLGLIARDATEDDIKVLEADSTSG
jgi:dihydroflavonol-4-reductase